jgi:RNA polymerase sigma factor (sigma-70 family)
MPIPLMGLFWVTSGMPKLTDRELVDRARQGDVDAFGQLVRRHQQRIMRLALHMLRSRSEAEDVAQETFIRAYQALARFDGRSEPYTWLYRIAVNLSLNTIRVSKRSWSKRGRRRRIPVKRRNRASSIKRSPRASTH